MRFRYGLIFHIFDTIAITRVKLYAGNNHTGLKIPTATVTKEGAIRLEACIETLTPNDNIRRAIGLDSSATKYRVVLPHGALYQSKVHFKATIFCGK